MDNDVLRQAPLFSALDDEAASALRGSMSENRLRRGDVLFHEGDSGDKLYIVLDGKVKLGRTSSDGRENLLAILGPGQMFGELSLSAQTTDRRVNAVRPTLFAAYPDAAAMAAAPREDLERIVGPLGFFRAKTESLLKLSAALVAEQLGIKRKLAYERALHLSR